MKPLQKFASFRREYVQLNRNIEAVCRAIRHGDSEECAVLKEQLEYMEEYRACMEKRALMVPGTYKKLMRSVM